MRQRRRRAWCEGLPAAALACAATLALAPAAAQPAARELPPLVVQRAPAASDCPDAAALALRVEKLAGKPAFVAKADAGGAPAFEVQILKSEEGYTAIVLAAGKSRQIADAGPTCASLADALALTLAILVDADEPPPAAPPAPPPPPPPPPVATFVPRPLPPPPERAAPRLLVGPSVGLSEGLSGSLVPVLALSAEARAAGPLSFRAGFTWMPSRDFALAPGHVEVQLLYGEVAACAGTWRFLGATHLGLCAQLNAGGLRGKGVGYRTTTEVVRPWTSFGLTGLVDVPVVGPLYWSSRLSAFVVAPLEAFDIRGIGVAFDPSPVGVLVGTGVGVRIF
jgi:hypothetical protein